MQSICGKWGVCQPAGSRHAQIYIHLYTRKFLGRIQTAGVFQCWHIGGTLQKHRLKVLWRELSA